MRNLTRKQRTHKAAFTVTELLVLVGVGALLTSVVLADFGQTRLKLLQQSCAANLKQWGMAMSLYANDYNGCIFGETFAPVKLAWDDIYSPGFFTRTNVYFNYFGGGGSVVDTIHTLRACPYVAAQYGPAYIDSPGIHSYSMADPLMKGSQGYLDYTEMNQASSPVPNFIFLSTRTIPYPSQYILLIDAGKSYFVHCGQVSSRATGVLATPNNDTTRPIDRHGGGVNCLFADQHVSWISYSNLVQQDTVRCNASPVPNPWFAEN
jgi:prepilin-type processing-associated H-X9-DG protein